MHFVPNPCKVQLHCHATQCRCRAKLSVERYDDDNNNNNTSCNSNDDDGERCLLRCVFGRFTRTRVHLHGPTSNACCFVSARPCYL